MCASVCQSKIFNNFIFLNNKIPCQALHHIDITHKGINIKTDLKPYQTFCELRNNQHVWQGCGEVGQYIYSMFVLLYVSLQKY